MAVLTVACVASQPKMTRQHQAIPITTGEPKRSPDPERVYRYGEDSLSEVEHSADRVTHVGVITHGDRKPSGAGGRHEQRQGHEGNHYGAEPHQGHRTDGAAARSAGRLAALNFVEEFGGHGAIRSCFDEPLNHHH